jgi:hypothetical protein
LLGRIFGAVTVEDAKRLAREECERRGWQWIEPVFVKRFFWVYHVMTNASNRGGNVNIWVDARSGRIKDAKFASR